MAFPRSFSYDFNRRASTLFNAFSRSFNPFCSSSSLSLMITSSSFCLISRSFLRSNKLDSTPAISSFLFKILKSISLIRLSAISISNPCNSTSFEIASNSRLLRTFICCSLYLTISFSESFLETL